MNHAPSLELALQLAAQEAVAARFSEIEPEHLLMGILKLAGLPIQELPKDANGAQMVEQLLSDIERLNAGLRRRDIESTPIRRRLRTRMGRGNSPNAQEQLHRSPVSRGLFQQAAEIAQAEAAGGIAASHLLEAVFASPTPLIRELVQISSSEEGNGSDQKREILAACGDLVQMAAAGGLPTTANREADVRAMRRVLGAARSKSILAICPSLESAVAAVHALAKEMQSSTVESEVAAKQLIELTNLQFDGKPAAEKLERLQSALLEAAEDTETIVVLPLSTDADPPPNALWPLVESALLETRVRLIVVTTPAVYEEVIAKNRRWSGRIHAIWLRGEVVKEIPKAI